MQCTSTVLMVRPAAFCFNEQTAASNRFQLPNADDHIQQKALLEFDNMVQLLKDNLIDVIVIEDTIEPVKPDAIFPNNWFSCNHKMVTVFPMYALNRRSEKRPDIIEQVKDISGITDLFDLSGYESSYSFLEGTGSMVCDHNNKVIYLSLSDRSDASLAKMYSDKIGYSLCMFNAYDTNGNDIYHTNVLMCIGENFAVICLDAIKETDRERVKFELVSAGHEVIPITKQQMNQFAGNMLQLINKAGQPLLLMSKTAFNSLSLLQLAQINKYASPLVADVSEIEKAGGGSVRCMVAEIFA